MVAAGETARVVIGERSAAASRGVSTQPVRSTASTLGWVGVGAAAVFSVSAVALGLATLDARDDFVASGNTDASARDRALAFRALTNVAWIAAAVSGIGATADVSYTFPLF